jgi:protein-disulfide isomerase
MASQPTYQPRRARRLAEREARRDSRPRRQSRRGPSLGLLSVGALAAGLMVVALAIVLGNRPIPTITEPVAVSVAHAPAGIPADGFVLGRADAPVTIELFEDFQCPACALWGRSVFPSLVENELRAGTVKVLFRDMAFLGPESLAAGRAGWAAAQQGRFWDMWATIYANQGAENSGAFERERLLEMAKGVGLDVARFEADMDSPVATGAISESRAAAAAAGVTSTPTLVIDGQAFVGVLPYEEIAAAIAAAAERP